MSVIINASWPWFIITFPFMTTLALHGTFALAPDNCSEDQGSHGTHSFTNRNFLGAFGPIGLGINT